MLKNKDIICFSSIDWDFNWQGHQEIMSTFSKNGNRVIFVENTGIRLPKISDLPRIKQRFLNWWNSFKGFRKINENLFVYSPLTIPFHYSKFFRWINKLLILNSLKKYFSAINFGSPIIWTFLPTPLTVDLIKSINSQLVVYYCIADFEELSPKPKQIQESERILLKNTDLVFAQCEDFKKRCSLHDNVHIFPFGVDISNFICNDKKAKELINLKHPIIGYIGGLHKYVDQEILKELSKTTNGTIVLVGPIQSNMKELESYKNIQFLGHQPIQRLPEFVNCFDVGIIPYVLNNYTKTVYPTKMNEYLAVGVPVVSTYLPEVIKFNKQHNIIEIVENKSAFADAIKKVISEDSTEKRERRMNVAKQNDWKKTINEMSEIMQKTLENKKTPNTWERIMQKYKETKHRVLAPAITFLLLVLLIFYTPLMWSIAEPLKINSSLEPSDAIIVFGGGLGEKVNSAESFQEKLKQAIDLHQKGLARNIVFSSNYQYFFSEAEIMKSLAISSGIPEENIILDKTGRNTYENLLSIKEISDKHDWKKVIIISSPYHLRRAVMTFKKLAPQVEVFASPARTQFYQKTGQGTNFAQLNGILREYAALVYYWWNDYL